MKDYTEELSLKLDEERAKNSAAQETLEWYQEELIHKNGEYIVEKGVIGLNSSNSVDRQSNLTF